MDPMFVILILLWAGIIVYGWKEAREASLLRRDADVIPIVFDLKSREIRDRYPDSISDQLAAFEAWAESEEVQRARRTPGGFVALYERIRFGSGRVEA